MVKQQNPHAGMVLFAQTRCGPMGGAVSGCGKMDSEAPKSSKHLKLLCLSWRKIKFFAGSKDMSLADAGTLVWGRGSVGVSGASLLVSLVCAAGLALLGSGFEAHVVEAKANAIAAPGGSRTSGLRI
jgi:hypothetical protein